MKDIVFKDEFYEFSVDLTQNRQYVALFGEWKDASVAKDYIKHNKESVDRLRPGFTSFVDLREAIMPSDTVLMELLDIFVQSIKYAEESGMKKQAQIVKTDIKDVSKTARKVMKDSDYDEKTIQFADPAEAERWLDI